MHRQSAADFERFCGRLGIRLEEFQRMIARAVLEGAEREVVVIIPRGNAKTTLAALLGLYHLLHVDGASIALGAASREQASIAYAIMRDLAESPALAGEVVARTHELRAEHGILRVLSGRGERAHGRSDSMMILDECHVAGEKLIDAFETGLLKRPGSKLLVISTAAESLASPLMRLRERALAGEAVRDGAFLDARAPGLRLLEWSVAPGAELTPENVLPANPASWIGLDALHEQRARCTPAAWAAFHACRPLAGRASWLPEGAWTRCRASYTVERHEPLIVGVDVGGTEAGTVAIGVTRDLRVGPLVEMRGDAGVLELVDWIVDLIESGQAIEELVVDEWRFASEGLRLERDHGVKVVSFPQRAERLVRSAAALHRAVVEGRLRHPGDARLDRAVNAAEARPVGHRGWRLDAPDRRQPIDLATALAMSVERAAAPVEEVPRQVVLGWI